MRRRGSAGSDKNVARDLRRKLLKGSHWPPIYVTMIRMWSVAEKRVTLQKVALLLPHELLQTLKDMGSSEVVFDASGLDTLNQKKYGQILEAMHGQLFIPVSLWGDGVPFSWDRKKSADLWCLSLPGQGHKPYRDLRLTLTSLPHENVIRATQDDLMDIFAWSFAHLAKGHFPWTRHDEQPWTDGDAWRKKSRQTHLLALQCDQAVAQDRARSGLRVDAASQQTGPLSSSGKDPGKWWGPISSLEDTLDAHGGLAYRLAPCCRPGDHPCLHGGSLPHGHHRQGCGPQHF